MGLRGPQPGADASFWRCIFSCGEAKLMLLTQTKHTKLLRTAADSGLSLPSPCPGGNRHCAGQTFKDHSNACGNFRTCLTCGCVTQIK